MINLGLTRISRLVKHLTPPTWKAVHVAGTNGKGSVAAYLSSLFIRQSVVQAASNQSSTNTELRIGRFTSPHLIDRWDCVTVNDKPVSKSMFLMVEEQIKATATRIQSQNHQEHQQRRESPGVRDTAEQITEFELLTATAFEIFTQQQCQVAVMECGLGGRLDATNVLQPDQVAASVITKIGLDHQGLLGDTVEDIAREKAGIAKPKVPLIVDGTNLATIKAAVEQIADASRTKVYYTEDTTDLDIELPEHQKQNMALALLAFHHARSRIPSLDIKSADESIYSQVISDVKQSYPGRLQHLSISPIIPTYHHDILLDGAHNPQSAMILREYIADRWPSSTTTSTPVHWILAISQGKDAAKIFKVLLNPSDTVTFCGFGKVEGMPWVRSTDPADLAHYASEITTNVHTCRGIEEALRHACALAQESGGLVVVAGSLYLVSDLLKLHREKLGGSF